MFRQINITFAPSEIRRVLLTQWKLDNNNNKVGKEENKWKMKTKKQGKTKTTTALNEKTSIPDRPGIQILGGFVTAVHAMCFQSNERNKHFSWFPRSFLLFRPISSTVLLLMLVFGRFIAGCTQSHTQIASAFAFDAFFREEWRGGTVFVESTRWWFSGRWLDWTLPGSECYTDILRTPLPFLTLLHGHSTWRDGLIRSKGCPKPLNHKPNSICQQSTQPTDPFW